MKKIKFLSFLSLLFILGCSSSEINSNQEQLEVSKKSLETPKESNIKKEVSKEVEKEKILTPLELILKKLPVIPPNTPVKEVPYLTYTNHLVGDSTLELVDTEEEVLEFYKNTTLTAYGSNSSSFRWRFTRSKKDLSALLNKNLYSISKTRSRDILTLTGQNWTRTALKENPIGNLKSIHIVERGKSGMALTLLIEGERGTYLLYNKYNIRRILGGGTYEVSNSVTGRRVLNSPTQTPSGFIAFEEIENVYYFYGGGYGHGVGMAQSGVQDLVKNYGKTFREVLSFYYPGTNIEKYPNKNIRVAITNSSRKLDHSSLTFVSGGKSTIRFGGKTYTILRNKPFRIENRNGNITITENKKVIASGKGTVNLSSESTIGISAIQRNNLKRKTPYYRGTFEVKLSKTPGQLRVINEVGLENYLRQVVPSEMSPSFGVEALKAQAVAARTYAVRDIERYRYKKDGYHIDDTASSQVYNGNDENTPSNEAVKATAGLILKYKGAIVDAKYYSTSSGFGEAANYVW